MDCELRWCNVLHKFCDFASCEFPQFFHLCVFGINFGYIEIFTNLRFTTLRSPQFSTGKFYDTEFSILATDSAVCSIQFLPISTSFLGISATSNSQFLPISCRFEHSIFANLHFWNFATFGPNFLQASIFPSFLNSSNFHLRVLATLNSQILQISLLPIPNSRKVFRFSRLPTFHFHLSTSSKQSRMHIYHTELPSFSKYFRTNRPCTFNQL